MEKSKTGAKQTSKAQKTYSFLHQVPVSYTHLTLPTTPYV